MIIMLALGITFNEICPRIPVLSTTPEFIQGWIDDENVIQ